MLILPISIRTRLRKKADYGLTIGDRDSSCFCEWKKNKKQNNKMKIDNASTTRNKTEYAFHLVQLTIFDVLSFRKSLKSFQVIFLFLTE